MKLKRFFVIAMAMAMLVSAMALPANAANNAMEKMRANIYGGATVSSQSARKNVIRSSLYYNATPASSDGWSTKGDEYVYFRGRNSSGTSQATDLALRNYYGTMREGNLTYLSGYGSVGSYYRMAIEYANDNPYQYVYLNVGWAP